VPTVVKLCPDGKDAKVETSAFSSGASVDVMLRQAEELFAARFGAYLGQSDTTRYRLFFIGQSEVIRSER
jgi:hypothetical protein